MVYLKSHILLGLGAVLGGCEDVWPSGSARGARLGSQCLPGGAGARWGMAGSQPCSEQGQPWVQSRLVPGVPGVPGVPASHQPCTPSQQLRHGAEAGYQGRRRKDAGAGKVCTHGWPLPSTPEARVFCLNWELNVGRLQGQFVQLDCGRISKWVQGQGRLRKQEMCLCSRNIYQVK